jgi:hypothetical protein
MTAYMRTAVVILAGAALFGCATTAENTKSKPAATAATVKDPNCLTETGGRIAATGTAKCRGYGRAYSSSDIDTTGKTNAGDALAQLDPAITVHH